MKVKIKDIIIKDRMRKELGNLSELKASIKDLGLIHPITLSEEKHLIAGYRRLQCVQQLGLQEIECNIVVAPTDLEQLKIEAAENIARKNFTSDEIIAISKRKEYLNKTKLQRFFYHIKLFLSSILKKISMFFKKIFE